MAAEEKVLTADLAKAVFDRRRQKERRSGQDRRQRNEVVTVERRSGQERRKTERRRMVDPTTCERDYTAEEIEFMNAMDRYRREAHRPFPTWSEVLEVLKSLGYRKVAPPTDLPLKKRGAAATADSSS
jgi:hypothetical protein